MTSLYQLTAEYRAIADKLHESELDEQTIADTLESVSGDLQEKLVNVAKYAKNEDSDADQIEKEANAMLERAKAKRNRSENLWKYMQSTMEACDISKIESPWFVISIKKNPESVVVDDESTIPRDYFKEVPATFKLDKNLCKQAIKDGYTVPGCHLARTIRLEIK